MLLTGYGKLSNQELDAFRSKYHLDLPEDYQKFLLENNGGTAEGSIILFDAKGIKEKLVMGDLFGVNHPISGLSIETWQEMLGYELLENMVIIGGTAFTGLLLLVNQEDWKGVYFWDDCVEYETSTEEACMYFVADTFTEFLDSLYLGDEDDDNEDGE